jgi:hypothetical protein
MARKRTPPKNQTAATPGAPGPGGRYFADPSPEPLDNNFQTKVTDSRYYSFLVKKAQPVPSPTRTPPILSLDEVLGSEAVARIQKAGHIVFHSVGDTGPTRGPETLNNVVNAMVADFSDPAPDQPQFFYHLGDVVYNFGEPEYYYEQFYEPFRNYPAPIFAIPGNHDGMVYRSDRTTTLEAFWSQFCAPTPDHPPEAGGLARTTMTQPGVYFTLQAPFVTIIGLYSNALENPGVISSENGLFPQITDAQLTFLTSELKRVKNNPGALLLATHHPPFSSDARHGGSPKMLAEIDACCKQAGVYPDAFLSGHAHIYQRFTRTIAGRQIPYLVAGSGGHNLQKIPAGAVRTPARNASGDVQMEKYFSVYGYLRIVASPTTLTIEFQSGDSRSASPKSPLDRVIVDLKSHKLAGTHPSS